MEVRSASAGLRHIVVPLLSLLVTIPHVVVAQTTTIGSQVDQRNENRPLLPDLERNEARRRAPGDRRPTIDPRFVEYQIRDDLRRLESLNNQVREDVAQSGSGDKRLIKPLGEIRKRAARLKTNLALTVVDGNAVPSEPEASAELATLFGRLDQSINSFLGNAMFRNGKVTQVIDVKLGSLARADLDRVMTLSKLITARIRKETK